MWADRLPSPPWPLIVAGGAAVVVADAAGWRTAVLALVASSAVAATRVRFSGVVAACLLAVTAALAYLHSGG